MNRRPFATHPSRQWSCVFTTVYFRGNPQESAPFHRGLPAVLERPGGPGGRLVPRMAVPGTGVKG